MKTKLLFLSTLLSLVHVFASAHDLEVKNADGVTIYYNYSDDGKELSVTYRDSKYESYTDRYSENIVIPEEVTYMNRTLKVTSIEEYAFYRCSKLTSITIPNSIKRIGYHAFYGCSGLTSITIPNSVTSMDNYAFVDCSNLTKVTIDSNHIVANNYKNTMGPRSIGSLFGGNVKEYIIGNSVTSIGLNAFYENNIISVIIGNNVERIQDDAFHNCSSLTSITIPNSMTYIGEDAFKGCSSLKKVIVPDIAAWCNISFHPTSSNPLSYAHHIYSDENTEITDLVIPNSVTNIGNSAFYKCSGLTSIHIPNSVTNIGNSAFGECDGLTSVNIPNSVTNIGEDAFKGCSSLKKVIVPDIAAWCNIFFHTTSSNPLSYAHHIYSDKNTEITDLVIPNSVTYIGNSAFYKCSGLTSINIGNSVRSIGNSAFYYCDGLTSVNIPNSVTSIGDKAFYNCSGLTSINIGNSVRSIGNSAFSCCDGLTSISIAEDNKYYDSRDNCNAIIEINTKTLVKGCKKTIIPNSVTSIGDEAFSYCHGLTSVNIPNSVTNIGNSAFFCCDGLTSVNIPNSVTSIGDEAFISCSGLTSINIGNSVRSIGNSAFYYCSGITSINIGNSVRSIGNSAFSSCSGLTSIHIPNSVTSIGDRAFYYCSGLTSVIIGSNVKSIGNNAFIGCDGITTIVSLINSPFAIYGKSDYQGRTVFSSEVIYGSTLYVPKGTITQYKSTNGWKEFSYIMAGVPTDVTNVKETQITIQNDGGVLTIQGVQDGTEVEVYSLSGASEGSAISQSGQATVNTNLQPGSFAIVKIGTNSIKVRMK